MTNGHEEQWRLKETFAKSVVWTVVSIDLCKVHFLKNLIGTLRCRGGHKACPIKISDLVLLHNKASEGLVKT